ncbi:hypothetical protein [Flavihumibacter sp. ZG627]|uniref:hypothetical protein n=1 Tax=Flavihumibacter sp. ZG627 TaxID=1463156 RepID=UPI0012DFF84F|nr:hypothetical protein [Flavihumibacter sp. ZG627]
MSNMNWLAMAIGLNNLKKNGITDSSEKSKTMLYPMLVRDPMASFLTVDLSTKKAVEAQKASNLSTTNSQLSASTDAALRVIADYKNEAGKLMATITEKAEEDGLSDDIKAFLNNTVLKSPVFNLELSEATRNAILSAKPELREEVLEGKVNLESLKDLFNP